jgi:hypothetical protein
MDVFTSWKQRRAEKRTKRRAKAQSDEIDRQLQEESKLCKQKHDILLISSCFLSSCCIGRGIVRAG